MAIAQLGREECFFFQSLVKQCSYFHNASTQINHLHRGAVYHNNHVPGIRRKLHCVAELLRIY